MIIIILILNNTILFFYLLTTSAISGGANIINLETGEIINLSTAQDDDIKSILSDIAIFNCDDTNKICKKTIGYIKSKTGTNYSIFNGKSKNSLVKLLDSTTCGTSDNGKLTSEGKLCSNTVALALGTTAKNYLLSSAVSSTVFKDYNKNTIAVLASQTSFIYNNLYSGNTIII